MKIALCMSGQPRSLEAGFEYHKRNLLDQYQVDVFVHSWHSTFDTKVLDLYKPVSYLYESPKFFEYNQKWSDIERRRDIGGWTPRSIVSMWYSVYKSNELKSEYENKFNFKYDWVIRSRFDYALNIVIPFITLNSIPLYLAAREEGSNDDHACDQFAFGNSDIMNIYSKIFKHVDEYYPNVWIVTGEQFLTAHLHKYNLLGDRINKYDMDYPFSKLHGWSRAHGCLIRDDRNEWLPSSI